MKVFRAQLCFFSFFLLILSACAGRGVEPTPYLPPTAVFQTPPAAASFQELQAGPISGGTPAATPEVFPTPDCTANLTFLDDLTIPDGTAVSPGERLDKRWQVENSGSCNWGVQYSLKRIAGPDLGVPAEAALYPARSGTQAEIRMLFTSPQEPGTYRSAWQAFDPQGEPFGDPIFIEISVVNR